MNNSNNQLSNDIQAAKEGVKDFARSFLGERQEFDKLAYFRNPASMLDEVLLGLWALMYVALGFTVYYGCVYHLSIFEAADNPAWKSVIISLSIFCAGEIIKVHIGHRFVRSVFSGFFKQGLPQLVLVGLMGILTYCAFIWSVGISQKGYGLVTANKSKQDALSKTGDYTAATAPFDAQIVSANETIKAGQKMAKRRNSEWEGLQMIKAGGKALADANAQRQSAIDLAKSQDDSFLKITGEKITATQLQQNEYGGIAEYVVMFCLLMIGLIEVIAFRENSKNAVANAPTPTPKGSFFGLFNKKQTVATAEQKPNETPVEKPQIGFKYGSQTVITEMQPNQTVITEIDEDSIKLKIGLINSECAKYEVCKSERSKNSIVGRLADKMNNLSVLVTTNNYAFTADCSDMYNRAFDRGKNIIREHLAGQSRAEAS